MEEKLFPRVLEILLTRFSSCSMPSPEDITPDSALHDDIGMDSLDIVDVIIGCETAFNINLNTADAKNVRTLRDLCQFIIKTKPSVCDSL